MPAASLPATAPAPAVTGAAARARRKGAQTNVAAAAAASLRRLGRLPPPPPTPALHPHLCRGPLNDRRPPTVVAARAAASAPSISAPTAPADLPALFAREAPPGGWQQPQDLSSRFGVEGFVEFYAGEGGLPLCFLHHPSGHSVEVYLQGATVTRWLDGARRDLLMPPRPDAAFRLGAAIR